MKKSLRYNVAVVGATGIVGREILNYLDSRKFPVSSVVAIASKDSFGDSVSFGKNTVLSVSMLENYDFTGIDIVFFAAGSTISSKYVPIATKCGAVVIDNTSCFRMDADVPLIIPEINPHDAIGYKKKSIIANPNCSTIELLVPLYPLHVKNKIKRVVVSTYQSVSGAGRKAMDELYEHTKKRFVFGDVESKIFPKKIAFNCIPEVGNFAEDGHTTEEIKMMLETQKIIGGIKVASTCVRVPVFVGHSEAVHIEFRNPITVDGVREILASAPGVILEKPGEYTTPIDIVHEDGVFVSRVRKDSTIKNGIAMWIVADNVRKGGALNAVQIAELLIKDLAK